MHQVTDAGALTSPHSLTVGGGSGGVTAPALLDCPVCRLSKPCGAGERKAGNTGLVVERPAQELPTGAAGDPIVG